MKVKGNNILIVGGASGIGRLLGILSIEKGASSVTIWDVNDDNIDKVTAEFRFLAGGRTKIFGLHADVSNNGSVRRAYSDTLVRVGQVFGIYHTMDNFTGRKQQETCSLQTQRRAG